MNRGERLNNPFNLKYNPHLMWQGLVVPSSDPVFCQFIDALHGLRAGFLNLKDQSTVYLTTIRNLITKYAPPSENNTEAYIRAICAALNMTPDQPLNTGIFACLKPLGIAIITHEQGECIYSDDLINQALALIGVTDEMTTPATSS
jgi:hypothetical protein